MRSAIDRLDEIARVSLGHVPTPLEEMPRLSAYLGGPRLLAKRDDCTGLGLGGNKVRKLEYVLAAALAEHADCVVCGGVVQSNTARQVAAACARLGLECHLGILHGRVRDPEPGYELSGNILLDRRCGAVIHDIPWDGERNGHLHALAARLRAAGRRPYLVPYGASDALGALGYARMAVELLGQCDALGIAPTGIVHASGSGGTQAGIVAGLSALDRGVRCIGIDVDADAHRVAADVRRIGREVARLLGADGRWHDEAVEVLAGYAGAAYGAPAAGTGEAIALAARLEGLVLDPVYSGKAMAGLIGLVRAGRFSSDDVVVWLHTGGAPALFAYPATMTALSADAG